MLNNLQITYIDTSELIPYANNAKNHPDYQINQICNSINQFGFNDPIAVDEDNVIIEGHGRLLAAKQLGIDTVPVIRLDYLDEDAKKAYILAHNKLTMNSGFDIDILNAELESIETLDMSEFGFLDDVDFDIGNNEEYNEFVDKFKPKLTTDDCYTPDNIYEEVADWVANEYNIPRDKMVRPFYPGGDYENFDYSNGAVVVDNPPFSIITKICKFYAAHDIKFFMFCPALTLFSTASGLMNYLPLNVSITYHNGANVVTSFITNMGDTKIHVAGDLYQRIAKANEENTKPENALPSYIYPTNVLTSLSFNAINSQGNTIRIKADDCSFTRSLDSQTEAGKVIFGCGFIVSDTVVHEVEAEKAKAEAEKAKAGKKVEWQLSDRELNIVKKLNGGDS